jgi:hypothetical protein
MTHDDEKVHQAEMTRAAKLEAYQQDGPFQTDTTHRDVSIKTVAKLIYSTRRELIPLIPLRDGQEQENVDYILRHNRLEHSLNFHFGEAKEKDTRQGVVHDRVFLLRRAIFETAQHHLQHTIMITLFNAFVCRTPSLAEQQLEQPHIVPISVQAEIAIFAARHQERAQDTVAALVAARDDIVALSRRCQDIQFLISAPLERALSSAIWTWAHTCTNTFVQLRCDKGPPV